MVLLPARSMLLAIIYKRRPQEFLLRKPSHASARWSLSPPPASKHLFHSVVGSIALHIVAPSPAPRPQAQPRRTQSRKQPPIASRPRRGPWREPSSWRRVAGAAHRRQATDGERCYARACQHAAAGRCIRAPRAGRGVLAVHANPAGDVRRRIYRCSKYSTAAVDLTAVD